MGKRASPQGDVFSFGVLILEILTGIRPTDVLFNGGSTLQEWIKSQYPHKLDPIIDQALARYSTPMFTEGYLSCLYREVVVELIELGLMCTQHNPSTRPTMLDVALEMARLKQYLSSHRQVAYSQGSTSSKEPSRPHDVT